MKCYIIDLLNNWEDDRSQVYHMDDWYWDYLEVTVPYLQYWSQDVLFEIYLHYPSISLEFQEVYPSFSYESQIIE
jgi:hypothetical protein